MDRPNILFIMTDQQAAHMMSCAGNDLLETPAMDGLARDGIRFEKAYCTNPVCLPSRTSMATGVMSCRLGADNNGGNPELPSAVDANSMGKLMKNAGYDTFHGGKVHMCRQLDPANAGYDVVFEDQREALPEACIEFIKKERSSPFFAVASFINPHDICFAHRAKNGVNTHGVLDLHEQALSLSDDELPPLPDNYGITEDEPSAVGEHLSPEAITPAIRMRDEYDDHAWRINRWIYHRLTEQVDKLIGEILDGLREAGHEEDTLVIFTSDHGNMDASHHLASKGLFYEESVSVPMIMRYKSGIAGGQVDGQHLVSTGLDILPTMCDYAGLEKPGHMLGLSLRPLAERAEGDDWRSYVASENHWFRMIRSGRHKYSRFASQESKECLFDLENDPRELVNLADDPEHQDVLSHHRRLCDEWAELSGDHKIAEFITIEGEG